MVIGLIAPKMTTAGTIATTTAVKIATSLPLLLSVNSTSRPTVYRCFRERLKAFRKGIHLVAPILAKQSFVLRAQPGAHVDPISLPCLLEA